ncbi:response regulator [Dongshaea marina]|uniref:response regulator n=1 Tax=Dongshaea marina TaxID=2047966 RepID=UPI000D3E2E9D|nr:response regulator transcription factor [Dongshaea marina]
MNKKILIVDDHPLISGALSKILSGYSNVEVLDMLHDGKSVYNYCLNNRVDIIILDLMLPDMHGIDVINQIKRRWENIQILVITSLDNTNIINEVIDAGASGFVSKNSDEQELLAAIRTVIAGGRYFCNYEVISNPDNEKPSKGKLSVREKQIVKLIASGYKSREISEELCISLKTVENHRSNIMQKLGARNMADVINYANQRGLE